MEGVEVKSSGSGVVGGDWEWVVVVHPLTNPLLYPCKRPINAIIAYYIAFNGGNGYLIAFTLYSLLYVLI